MIGSMRRRDPSLTIEDVPRICLYSEADERTVMRCLLGGDVRGGPLRRRILDAIARVKAERADRRAAS